MGFVYGRQKLAFGDVLNFFVQRENDVVAAVTPGFRAIEPFLVGVGHHHDFLALAANVIVERVFDTAQALFIHIHKTNHVGSQSSALG